jgi:peptidoglycan/xylan/chitin deacetylase (PgdA/CDA1 family)
MKASQDAAQKAERDREYRQDQQHASQPSSSPASSSSPVSSSSSASASHPQKPVTSRSTSTSAVTSGRSPASGGAESVESLSQFSDNAAQEQAAQEQAHEKVEQKQRQQYQQEQADRSERRERQPRRVEAEARTEAPEAPETSEASESTKTGNPRRSIRSSRSVAGSFGSNDYYAEVDTTSLGQKYVWRVIAAIVVIILVIFGAWFWANHVRHIDIKVGGHSYVTRVNTDVASFVKEHRYFGAPAGNLLAVDGSVIRAHGGSAPQVLYNGNPLSAAQSPHTYLHDGDTLTVTAGGDITEAHTVTRIPVEPGLKFTPGGVIQFVKVQGKAGYRERLVGKTSHRVVDLGIVKKPVDTEVDSLSPRPQGNGKYVALTFDDGPSPKFTEQYLKILKDNKVHATFFNIGSQAKTNAELEKKLLREGNELASHTWNHPDLVRIQSNADEVRSEVLNAENQVAHNVGRPAPNAMIRMPYGSYSKKVWEAIHAYTSSAALWDIDTRDWAFPGSDAIVSTVMRNVHNGSVILMHDGGGDRTQDVQALPQIISQLKSQGYKFVTLSKLMQLDGRFPKAVIEQKVMR